MPYANNNGVKIHYEVEGHGPALMLLHGFGFTLDSWRELGYTQEFSKDFRLILVDARGHGASDKPLDASAYGFRTLVGDLLAILDELNIDKTSYFGYSMGGRIGFRIPIHAPQRFNSLVLGGAHYPITGKEDSEDDMLIFLQLGLEIAIKEAPEKPMEFILATMEKVLGSPMQQSQRAMFLANDPRALLVLVRAFRSAVSPKPEEVLPRISVPCQLFVGEADSRFPTVRECAGRIPGASFFSLPGLDHVQALVRIDLVLPHVKKFLGEVSKNLRVN